MNERERAITNLMAVDLRGGSHEMLSSIAKAIYKPTCGGWTIGACQVLRDTLVNLLSETDEEALREAYMKGRNDGFDRGFASADDWCAQHEDAMAEHGWYRALDADKAPIRIGDKVDSDHHEDGTVMGVQFYEMPRGIRTLVAVRPDGWDVATWHTPDEYRHHKQPTVEGVLRDMHVKLDEVTALYVGEAIDSDERDRDEARIFAEYSAKLQLRGDAE